MEKQMGNPEQESDRNKEVVKPADDFFSGEPSGSGSFGDPQGGDEQIPASLPSGNLEAVSADKQPGDSAENSQTANPATETTPAAPGAGLRAPVSFNPQDILRRYFETSKKLLFSPMKFFKEMERTGGLIEPGIFLALSAVGNGILSVLMGNLNLSLLPRNSIAVVIACFVLSGLSCVLAKGMGSKCSFETTFRVFAYCSCLSILMAIPGLSLLVPGVALFLYFLGLKEVLGVSLYQTVTIMALVVFMQVILTLGQMLRH
jgi:hypothetical protein